MVMFYAFVALCFSSGALAQIIEWGPCPEVEAMQDFDLHNIQGRWYEAGRYFSPSALKVKCVKNDFLHGGGHGIIQMNTSAISRETGKAMSINGIKVRVADAEKPGELELQLPSSKVWTKYSILGSEANSWMVASSCVDMELIHLQYMWIMTRQQQPTGRVLDKAVKALKEHYLSGEFMFTDQEHCDVSSGSDESEGDEDYKDAHLLF